MATCHNLRAAKVFGLEFRFVQAFRARKSIAQTDRAASPFLFCLVIEAAEERRQAIKREERERKDERAR